MTTKSDPGKRRTDGATQVPKSALALRRPLQSSRRRHPARPPIPATRATIPWRIEPPNGRRTRSPELATRLAVPANGRARTRNATQSSRTLPPRRRRRRRRLLPRRLGATRRRRSATTTTTTTPSRRGEEDTSARRDRQELPGSSELSSTDLRIPLHCAVPDHLYPPSIPRE